MEGDSLHLPTDNLASVSPLEIISGRDVIKFDFVFWGVFLFVCLFVFFLSRGQVRKREVVACHRLHRVFGSQTLKGLAFTPEC